MTTDSASRPLPVGAVLAGGESRRMGRDKALLRLDGATTLLERAVAALRAAGLGDVAVVVSTPERAWSLRVAVPGLRATPFLSDKLPNRGPLGGLYTALRAYGGRDVLLVACDMPRLDPRALRLLTAPHLVAADIVLPRPGGREQPLHARYGPACLPVAARLLEEEKLAMHTLLTAPTLRVHVLSDAELARHGIPATVFTNVNTPADLAVLADAHG